MTRVRKREYLEADTLPAGEVKELLVEWRKRQNLVISGLLEYWRKASPAQKQSLPWYWEAEDGINSTVLRSRDGQVLLRIARIPSGDPVLLWALSAGTLDGLEETLRELRESWIGGR